MSESGAATVVDRDGVRGTVERPASGATSGEYAEVTLDDGRRVFVPAEMFVRQVDGSYYIPVDLSRFAAMGEASEAAAGAAQLVVPVIREELEVGRRTVETGRVRIHKLVREHEETVDEPLLRDEVRVERVAVNRFVDAPPTPRVEGEVTVLPLVEEVLVVQRRLLLREELHITKRQIETRNPQTVTLKSEEVRVERIDARTGRVTDEGLAEELSHSGPAPSRATDNVTSEKGRSN